MLSEEQGTEQPNEKEGYEMIEEKAKSLCNVLMTRADMLLDYFSIEIEKEVRNHTYTL